MIAPGCLALIVLLFLFLVPFLYAEIMFTAMAKLGLSSSAALMIVFGVLFGSFVNIPIKRIPRREACAVDIFQIYGISRLFPQVRRWNQSTLIAVNLGGCVIPCLVALFQLIRIAQYGGTILAAAIIISVLNVAVCYFIARPVAGVGIMMPALVPPIVAAGGALLLAPNYAPPVAFVAGVAGPVIGADLLHLKDIHRISTGVASIGGAGTFDGIVLSGVVAAFLA
ncbi:MAG TPA: DUF1614 domain-containing protein [Acidobacteriota bacterium]|nr:DUF1614 domain-containing protein [Acidobacteriota bacterium]